MSTQKYITENTLRDAVILFDECAYWELPFADSFRAAHLIHKGNCGINFMHAWEWLAAEAQKCGYIVLDKEYGQIETYFTESWSKVA